MPSFASNHSLLRSSYEPTHKLLPAGDSALVCEHQLSPASNVRDKFIFGPKLRQKGFELDVASHHILSPPGVDESQSRLLFNGMGHVKAKEGTPVPMHQDVGLHRILWHVSRRMLDSNFEIRVIDLGPKRRTTISDKTK